MGVIQGRNCINFNVNAAATIPAYRVLKLAATSGVPRGVALWDTATAAIAGISQEQSVGNTGTSIWTAISGTAKAQAGASVSASALLTALTATGEVVEATVPTFNTTTGNLPFLIGHALESGATGAAVEILINITPMRLVQA